MEDVFSRIVNRGEKLTRQDVADLLASISPPGKKRELKRAKVEELFNEAGHSPLSPQGHNVIDNLETWVEW